MTFTNPFNKQGDPERILELNRESYQKLMNIEINEPKDYDINSIRPPEDISKYVHANATILALVRNSEARQIASTIRQFEASFNSKFMYPYTFINDSPFSERFKAKVKEVSNAPMNFITIPRDLWARPSSIDAKKAEEAMKILTEKSVAYANKLSYHNMCRFYSGTFYNIPELLKFKYYWRIEPQVKFFTDIKYDVFKYLEGTQKVYGFTLSLYDIEDSVTTLWPETIKFLNSDDNYKYINPNGAFQWLLENQQNPKKAEIAGGYSTCHFWSNFEIGDMDFFRGEAYTNWFKHLDSTGKFYYERWGDAPVHSIGLGLFADKSKIHWFRDIGYEHDPYLNCPNSKNVARCKTGLFSRWDHLQDQNCMASWVDYSMADPAKIY
ncbi:uncharacterized protein KQ657_004456 [Scheffersomyces spartinae]|uniref:Mannosyltransferase n=1 Tax=Scheffersomyces spartinae TaxID=45513 RepID=A0A9P8AJH6_9ASCO|nr:uncharacterized protein KQ657_004456 [Scheffersomyces spartinae]KAG7194776.1 hypothetical protein KQ657_004456 [Scheffersomyces spartinae]